MLSVHRSMEYSTNPMDKWISWANKWNLIVGTSAEQLRIFLHILVLEMVQSSQEDIADKKHECVHTNLYKTP